MQTNVLNRLDDDVKIEEYSEFLKDLGRTEMEIDNISSILNNVPKETRSWVGAEAFAEAYLETNEKVLLPWNNSRDLRNAQASLPGADIIGIITENSKSRFIFGEVKKSSQNRSPPDVNKSLADQLEKLIKNQGYKIQLIIWLSHRVKNTEHESIFASAISNYFSFDDSDFVIFGILVRDTKAKLEDLLTLGKKLQNNNSTLKNLHLIGLYIPWSLDKLISKIRGE